MTTRQEEDESASGIALLIVIGFLAGLVCYALGYNRGVMEQEAAQRQAREERVVE